MKEKIISKSVRLNETEAEVIRYVLRDFINKNASTSFDTNLVGMCLKLFHKCKIEKAQQ